MKFIQSILIISLMLLMSCGENPIEEETNPNNPGINGIFLAESDNTLSDKEMQLMNELCFNLEDKEEILKEDYTRSFGDSLNYKLLVRDCKQRSFIETSFSARVSETGGRYYLRTTAARAMTNVLSRDSREFSDLCEKVRTQREVKRFIQKRGRITVYSLEDAGRGDCLKVDSGEKLICLTIGTGAETSNQDEYKIYQEEKFRTLNNSNSKYNGFVLNRYISSSKNCSGDVFEVEQVLNN